MVAFRGDFSAGLRLLDRARENVGSDTAGKAVMVQLDLCAAMLAARSGDVAQADGYLEEARSLSTEFRLPEAPYHGVDASMTNILAHWCAAPVENYDGTEAVRRAAEVEIADPHRPERVGHHHIDMARAWVLHGDRRHALKQLNLARRVAPNTTRHHPAVRETVLAMANADHRATDSLAGFARWAHIKV
ncbi:hypothetical protein [Amycolatopsis sp. H20-H5]|uniref:hypothetical protein n=1 Tax=Amycolatopsis sp. H20-H5 TaxID=3046309 RepID=UPI002DB687AE|nr:hypothetical protein [Amycolatopsis sp. H20-H5]MEC3974006.1 hypothetical protein [Amycolatopsis sp. H20-H5]